jgi:hypothetical protein
VSGVGFAVMTEVAKAALQRVARVWPAAVVVGVLALDLAFGSLQGASSPASVTSGYAYDVPIHAYDGGAHSVAMNVESASPVAPVVASLATQETVVQATAALSALSRLSVAANTETTTLFRSVGADEAADIASTGTFNNPAGINVKYFATNGEDATTWGNFLNPGESTIVTTRAPTSTLDGVVFDAHWDMIGPAFALDAEQLANLNQTMDGIRVVP